MTKTIDETTVFQIVEQSEFFDIGYEVEDGNIVRTVNNETGATIWSFGKVYNQ